VKVHALLFALVSVAVQVTVVAPLLNTEPLTGSHTTEAIPQLSFALGAVQVTAAVQTPASVFRVTFAGQVMEGFSASLIVTVNVQELLLPLVSVVVQVTGVTPLLKLDPLAGLQTTEPTAQLSLAAGAVQLTIAVQRPASVFCVTFAGQVMDGFSLSLTVTSNWQVLVLPAASLAVQVTCVVPLGKAEPLTGLQTTATLPSQLSAAVGT